jgi:hypothetical protein
MDISSKVVIYAIGALGGIIFACGVSYWIRFIRRRSFPIVEGQLISHGVALFGFEGQVGYRPVVSFRYTVGGIDYTSSRVFSVCPYGWPSKVKAEQYCSQLAVKPFAVHYNSARPSDAYLINGPFFPITMMLGVGGIFIVIFFIYGVGAYL